MQADESYKSRFLGLVNGDGLVEGVKRCVAAQPTKGCVVTFFFEKIYLTCHLSSPEIIQLSNSTLIQHFLTNKLVFFLLG